MIGERTTIESSLPSKIPVSSDDYCSISHSDFLHRLKEIIYGTPSKKGIRSYGTTLQPGSLIIPLDPILPVGGIKHPINFADLQARLKKFSNAVTISSVDPNSIWALDVLIQKLYENDKLVVKNRSSYYCDYCRTALSTRDVNFAQGDRRILYCKIKISENSYLVYSGDEEVVLNVEGLLLNRYEKFVIQDQGDEKWIIQSDIFKKLIERELIFPTKIIEKTGEEIIPEFKEFTPVVTENQKTRLLSGEVSDNDAKIMGGGAKKLSYEIIDHEDVQGRIPLCKYCGKKVKRKRTKGVYLKVDEPTVIFHPRNFLKSINTRELLISKDFKNFPKIPILECDRCGKIEYGSMEKPCSCGGKMRNNYAYDPALLPVGVYAMTHSIKNKVFINHKNFRSRYLMFMFISSLRINYLNDVFIRYVNLNNQRIENSDPEILRLAYIVKKNGTLHENDIRKIEKLRNYLVNIINHASTYGVNEKETMIDQFILSKLERFKKSLVENVERTDLYGALDEYMKFMELVSKKYMKMLRGGKINLSLMEELISISYPFFPTLILDTIENTKYDIRKIEIGKFMINEMLEKLFDDIFYVKREITRLKIKRGMETGMPLKKIIIETDIRFIPIFINIKRELMNFLNANDAEITKSWQGLEYRVILKKDKLGEIYRPLGNTIEIILQKIDAKKLKSELEKGGYNIGVEGQLITITPNMVDFQLKLPEGFESVQGSNVRVYIDFSSEKELEDLFVAKKFRRSISFMKNRLNVEYDDYIRVSVSDSQILRDALMPYMDNILKDLKIIKINFTDRISEMLVLSFEKILEGGIDIGITPMYRKNKIKALSKLPSMNLDYAEKLFNSGYYSIMEIKMGDMKTISEKSGVPINQIKIVKEYLDNITSYRIIKSGDRYFCPMCEEELKEVQPFCPKCNSPLSWD